MQQQEAERVAIEPIELDPLPPQPLVSVLITNYNYEEFLGDAIESALRQTYQRIEVIIYDDGSTDRSVDVARGFVEKDDRARLLAQENRGHFAALNEAYEACRGQVVCILDADDYFHPDKVSSVLDAFREVPQAGMVVHKLGRVDREGRDHGNYPQGADLPQGWLGPDVLASGGFVQWIQTSMICLRSEVADRIFPLDPDLPEGPDIIFRAAAALLAPVAAIHEPLAYYRLHGANQGNSAQRFTLSDMVDRRRTEIERFGAVYSGLERWMERELPGVQLAEFESTRPFLERRYVIARLTKEPRSAQRELQQRLLRLQDTMTPALARFYRVSHLLPRRLFKSGLDLVYGQTRLKSALGAVKKLLPTRRGQG